MYSNKLMLLRNRSKGVFGLESALSTDEGESGMTAADDITETFRPFRIGGIMKGRTGCLSRDPHWPSLQVQQ